MAEELVPTDAFALRGDYQTIWHIAAGERWSDGALVGHRTYCGRNYPENVQRAELEGLDNICSDCEAQVTRRH
jgi:hypothetical protein